MNCLMNIDVDDLEKAIHFWGNRMTSNATDKTFTGSIPKVYETYLVPLIFEPYAADIARRQEMREEG